MTAEPNQCFPLHEAAKHGYINCIKLLLESNEVDLNEKDNLGFTPLQVAAEHSQLEAAKVLLESGADIDKRSNDDKTAVEIAKDEKMVALLRMWEKQLEPESSSSMDGQGEIIHEGFLWKSSGREKNKAKGWQKRWFVVKKDGTIPYYKSKKVFFYVAFNI